MLEHTTGGLAGSNVRQAERASAVSGGMDIRLSTGDDLLHGSGNLMSRLVTLGKHRHGRPEVPAADRLGAAYAGGAGSATAMVARRGTHGGP